MRLRAPIVLLVILPATLMYHACKNGGTNPPDDNRSDTTSHSFMWSMDTLGDGNASVLNDVAIINDTLAYAVGAIYLKDSTGQIDPQAYNFLKWDGKKWNLMRVEFTCDASPGTPFATRAIFAFGANDVWFCSAGLFGRWNGQTFSFQCPASSVVPGSINAMWGTSSNDLYAVGNLGTIVHYNGSSWQKLNSGTTVDIHDMWGGTHPTSGEETILGLASFRNLGRGLDLLSINGTSVSKLDTVGLHVNESGIWFEAGKTYRVVGNGVFSKSNLANASWVEDKTQPLVYKRAIRGSAMNDVFMVGDFGLISHYNGSSWKTYSELTMPAGILLRVAVRKDFVVAVGFVNNSAVAVRGSR